MESSDSILTSVKKLLGINEDYTQFDVDLIMHINSVFSVLTQLGIGPSDGFHIEDKTATWTDFLEDSEKLEMVKSFMVLRVRLLFDPPSSSFVLDSLQRQADEFTWRLQVAGDVIEETEGE